MECWKKNCIRAFYFSCGFETVGAPVTLVASGVMPPTYTSSPHHNAGAPIQQLALSAHEHWAIGHMQFIQETPKWAQRNFRAILGNSNECELVPRRRNCWMTSVPNQLHFKANVHHLTSVDKSKRWCWYSQFFSCTCAKFVNCCPM